MDPLATVAIGWAAGVTVFVSTLVLSGRLRLDREVAERDRRQAVADERCDELERKLEAVTADATAATRALAETQAKTIALLEQTVAELRSLHGRVAAS